MATPKKIRLDFTKTEERTGWNTRQMPEGLHAATVVQVEQTEAQDGTAMLVYGLKPEDSRYKSRLFPYYCKLQPNQMWKIRDLLVAAGETIGKKVVNLDPSKIIGKSVAIEVEDDSYNGQIRSQVQGVYKIDILDDDVVEDEEDEEEYDEEEVYEDEEEELEDEEEELEEDELEDEEDFDEDFDEDDLDDFDEDEEEEEEPPAPKRRAPAKKPATRKAAPARKPARRR